MIIKNPYRVTEYCGENEVIITNKGAVRASDWCKSEAERFIKSGIPAKAVKSGSKGWYVIRSSTLSKTDKTAEDIVD